MAKRRHHDCKADEERQRPDDQRRIISQSATATDRILERDAQRSGDGRNKPDVSVKQQRKGDDANAERERREAEADTKGGLDLCRQRWGG
jgi:hypothetical protein